MDEDAIPIRLSSDVRAQIDAQKAPTLFGLPVRPSAELPSDAVLLMASALGRAEARAWARGYQLGPLKFEFAADPNRYRVSCTADWVPRVPGH